jgi:hypothetical protein
MKLFYLVSLIFVIGVGNSAWAVSFPDACSHEIYRLGRLYQSIQSCATDQDCAYFDASLQEVGAKSGKNIVIDDCTRVPAFPVGNPKLLQMRMNSIIHLLEKIDLTFK